MTQKSVLIVGSTSAVAQAIAVEYASAGWDLVLAARNLEVQATIASDLQVRFGVTVHEFYIDAMNSKSAAQLAQEVRCCANVERYYFAIGAIGNSERDICNLKAADCITRTNYSGIAELVAELLPQIVENSRARLVFLSSVAGDRGRASNPLYCAAKAALNSYTQGLRQSLHKYGIQVCLIKLGFVDSRLSYGIAPRMLTMDPADAARQIIKYCDRGKNIVYVPFWWRAVMMAIKLIPEWLWKRLSHF